MKLSQYSLESLFSCLVFENQCSQLIELDQPTLNYPFQTSFAIYLSKLLVTKNPSKPFISHAHTHIPLRCAGLERVLGLRGYLQMPQVYS